MPQFAIQKLIFPLCLIFALAGSLSAQEKDVQELAALLGNISSFQADFRQIALDAQGNELQSTEGQFAVKRPGLFYWHVDPPLEQTVVSDGDQLWVYDPDLEQVTVQAMEHRLGQTPALLLSGSVDDLAQSFQISSKPAVDGNRKFELIPKDSDSLFERLRLTFVNGVLVQMHIADSLGQRSSLEFTNTRINDPIEDHLFSFVPPSGVDVITQ